MNNRVTFDLNKTNGKRHFDKFLNSLLNYNRDSDNDDYFDIHIYPSDNESLTIEWEKTPWGDNKDWGGSFKWVDSYNEVYTELHFPDNHYEMVPLGSEEEILKVWHQEHPEWVLNDLGFWTNKEENNKWAIENNLDTWLNIEKENDSTFNKLIVKQKDWVGATITKILRMVNVNVLRRTDYIVIGNDMITSCIRDDNFIPNSKESLDIKYGKLLLPIKIKEPWKEVEETIVKEITIYLKDECKSNILYLTDSNCLIAKQECMHSHKEEMEQFQKES